MTGKVPTILTKKIGSLKTPKINLMTTKSNKFSKKSSSLAHFVKISHENS